jgi:hypothetical protein
MGTYGRKQMLLEQRSERRASTGLPALDTVLRGLYWGDNVVWQLDATAVEPFYRANACRSADFDTRTFVSLGGSTRSYQALGLTIVSAGPGSSLQHPADLLREIHHVCRPGERRLLVFESLDSMIRVWGVNGTRAFFARCCPLLLDVSAIAYWSMSARETPAPVRETVESVTQCVLRVDERSVRVVKAEGRGEGVRGSLLHWHEEAGRCSHLRTSSLASPPICARYGARAS